MPKWRVSYMLWISGDESSKDPNEIKDLDSLEKCRQKFADISVNRNRGYRFMHATAYGPNGEKADLLE